jgi:heavy metal translocating P-type ATPase
MIAAGALAALAADGVRLRHTIWFAGLVLCGAPLVLRTALGLLRGKFAADVVAALAVVTAFLLNQPFVGLVIVLMQSGGEALEALAEGKATNALRALQDAAPRIVHQISNGVIEDVHPDTVEAGEHILVRPGEVLPVDGEVVAGRSHIDTSRITGEPLPITAEEGTPVMSGTVNQEGPLTIRVTAVASQSQYARIVQLVREAQASKTPLQRVADRYAAWFTPVTLLVCAIAYVISADWDRVLAVLAVATPCPLILATPVAVLGGMNQSARRQVLIRNGGVLESLGTVTAVVFDKTGTLTVGKPEVHRVLPTDSIPENELLELAAGVEQFSSHLLARTLVDEAVARGIEIPHAEEVDEAPGRGVSGKVGERQVLVGAQSFLLDRIPEARHQLDSFHDSDERATLRAYVAVGPRLSGVVEYADAVRPGMRTMVQGLREAGVTHITLLSGDRAANVADVAASVGIDEARGDLLPEDKVQAVRELMSRGESVLMLGDGTNDAPALSAATVGVALASQGRGVATESAGAILLADHPERIIDAIRISRRTMRIARQSIFVGLGLSAVGMVAAAAGFIPPVTGALMQEGVDLAVILNALRASRAVSS